MSPITHLLCHRCDVNRPVQRFIVGTKQPVMQSEKDIIAIGLRCRIDPLSFRVRATAIGAIASATHKMFWGEDIISNGDEVIWNGAVYRVTEVSPYYNARGKFDHCEGLLESVK